MTPKPRKPGSGGKRPGAGRKPSPDAVRSSSISLPETIWDKLDAIRGGSTRSAWVAAKIRAAKDKPARPGATDK